MQVNCVIKPQLLKILSAFSTPPFLRLPFRTFIQSFYHNVVYHLVSSSASNFLPITIPSRAFFGRQFLLSHWPSQFLFLFLINSSIIFSCQSILHSPSFSISPLQSTNHSVLPKGRFFTANSAFSTLTSSKP